VGVKSAADTLATGITLTNMHTDNSHAVILVVLVNPGVAFSLCISSPPLLGAFFVSAAVVPLDGFIAFCACVAYLFCILAFSCFADKSHFPLLLSLLPFRFRVLLQITRRCIVVAMFNERGAVFIFRFVHYHRFNGNTPYTFPAILPCVGWDCQEIL